MSKNRLFYIICFVCLLFLSCVSKGKYLELETDLQNTKQNLEQEQKNLADLEDRYNNLENEKQNLVQTSRDLNLKLKKEKTVVKEKAKVISDLEDTKKKIEEGLKEQIANQQIKIEEIEGKLKLTFIDKILFNSGSTKINEKGKALNFNYYDQRDIEEAVYPFIVKTLKQQLAFGIDAKKCFCLGTGKNYKFLKELNKAYSFFEEIIPLEHPRYIMQYRSKVANNYVADYINTLSF